MRRIQLAYAVGVIALFGALASLASMPEHISIDDCVNKKSATEFPHTAHFEHMECSACHHTQENLSIDSVDPAKPCSDCHNEPEKAGTPGCSQMSLKKNPFHINCVSCHKERAEGPTKCNDCHPKE